MKKVSLLIAMAFMMSPMLQAENFMEEYVYESCFDKADKVFNETEGTHSEKFDEFILVYDECMGN